MADVRNTQRKNERLHPLDAVEERFGAIGSEEVRPEQSAGAQAEVQASLQTQVQTTLRKAEEVERVGARHPGSSSREGVSRWPRHLALRVQRDLPHEAG